MEMANDLDRLYFQDKKIGEKDEQDMFLNEEHKRVKEIKKFSIKGGSSTNIGDLRNGLANNEELDKNFLYNGLRQAFMDKLKQSRARGNDLNNSGG